MSKLSLNTPETYTYVGSGTEIPEICHFMGTRFIRHEPVEVTDPAMLGKLKGHPCFVKGTPDKMAIIERDEAERKRVSEQRQIDQQKNNEASRQYQKYK